mgnify:CR=1 FL=1
MVRSQELKDGKPVASGSSRDLLGRAGRSAPWRAVGLVALVVGLVFWLTGARYTAADQIVASDLTRWLDKSIAIQWDYKNIVKRKGKLVRLV